MSFEGSARTRRDPVSKHMQLVADSTPSKQLRGVYCKATGTIDLGDEDGIVLPYDMQAGQWFPFEVATVGAIASGTFYGWG